MKICPYCGQKSADNTVFCPNCGTRIPDQAPVQPAPPPPSGFCPNCGAPQPAGSSFCANCGYSLNAPTQPQSQGPAPSQPQTKPVKKGGAAKKVLIALGIVALVAAIGVGVYFLITRLLDRGNVGPFASEAEQFTGYQQAAFADPLLSALETALDTYGGGISTDVTITASVKGNDAIQDLLKGSAIQFSLDTGKNSFLANAELVLMGSPVISGLVSYDDGTAGFYLPELDKNYYTADLDRLLRNLSDGSAEFPGMTFSSISGEEFRKLLQGYLDVVFTLVNEDNLTVEKNASFRLPRLKDSCTGTVYTLTPRAKDFEKMLQNLAGHLEKDKQLRKLLLEAMQSGPYASLLALQRDWDEDALKEGIDDLIAELVDQLEDSAAEIAEDLAERDPLWTLYMEGTQVRRVDIQFRINDGDTDLVFAYERSGSPDKGVTEMFYAEVYEDGETVTPFVIELNYTLKGTALTGKMEFTAYPDEDYGQKIRCKYDLDLGKRSPLGGVYGSYEMTYPIYSWYREENVDVTCTVEITDADGKSTDHVITIKGLGDLMEGSGNSIDSLKITINATDKCSAKVPGGKSVDISKYDMEELKELFTDLASAAEDALEEVIYNLGIGIGGETNSDDN